MLCGKTRLLEHCSISHIVNDQGVKKRLEVSTKVYPYPPLFCIKTTATYYNIGTNT